MWKQAYGAANSRRFKLINIRSGEIRELNIDKVNLDEIMRILFDNKYSVKKAECDSDFLSSLDDVYDYLPDEPTFADDDGPDWDDCDD
jgi:hypothetical protein